MLTPDRPVPRPGVLEIEPYVGGKAESTDFAKPAKLSANEGPLGASPKAIDAFKEHASSLHLYPDGHANGLRQEIARCHNIPKDQIVCGAGSDELLSLICLAFSGPGDETIYTEHGFLMYRLSSLAAGAQPVAVPETDLKTDIDAILNAVTSRTKIVFIANPNNPTGSYLTTAEIMRLRDKLPAHILLVIDAAYAEYVDAQTYENGMLLAQRAPNVVMTRTFSKLHGLAALRLGWMVASEDICDIIQRVRGPFNVNAAAQAAGIAAVADKEHQQKAKAHNDQWRPWLEAEIKKTGLTVYPSVANFLLVGWSDESSADHANKALEARGILVRAMNAYGLGHCLRISVGLEEENRRLVEALGEIQGRQG